MEDQNPQSPSFGFVEIPKIFMSDLTGAPIQECISCNCNLTEPGKDYLIEKAIKPYKGFKAYSTIFEYAICMPCANDMQNKISKESRKKIDAYFQKNIEMAVRKADLRREADQSVEKWLERCVINGMYVEEISECQIYAHCQGEHLVMHDFPYMVSGPALDEVVDLLSNQTLDDLENFKNNYVDGPSEFQDLLKSGPKVFI